MLWLDPHYWSDDQERRWEYSLKKTDVHLWGKLCIIFKQGYGEGPHLLERLIIKVESVPTRCQVYEDVKQLVKQKWLRLFSSEVTIYPGEKYEPSDTSPFFQSD